MWMVSSVLVLSPLDTSCTSLVVTARMSSDIENVHLGRNYTLLTTTALQEVRIKWNSHRILRIWKKLINNWHFLDITSNSDLIFWILRIQLHRLMRQESGDLFL